MGRDKSADRKRGQRKGATSKNVKSVKNIFDTFRHFSRKAKIVKTNSKGVKNIFDTFRHFLHRAKIVNIFQKVSKIFSTLFDNLCAAPVFRPLLGWGGTDFKASIALTRPVWRLGIEVCLRLKSRLDVMSSFGHPCGMASRNSQASQVGAPWGRRAGEGVGAVRVACLPRKPKLKQKTGKSCCSNRPLVKAILEAPQCL